MFGRPRPKKKREDAPKYPCRKLTPEEIARTDYTPPLSKQEIHEKHSIPSPDRSHWKDRK